MRIALIQQSASEDKSKNIKKGIIAVQEAAENGANIICFAELLIPVGAARRIQ